VTTTDHEYKGRIFGKSVLEATFRSFYGTDLFLGELLVAEDLERARRYLFRVIDVSYGSDSSDPNWAERTAGSYMAGDRAGQEYGLHDPEQRLYKVAKCAPLGYIDAGGEFRQPPRSREADDSGSDHHHVGAFHPPTMLTRVVWPYARWTSISISASTSGCSRRCARCAPRLFTGASSCRRFLSIFGPPALAIASAICAGVT